MNRPVTRLRVRSVELRGESPSSVPPERFAAALIDALGSRLRIPSPETGDATAAVAARGVVALDADPAADVEAVAGAVADALVAAVARGVRDAYP